MKNSFLEKEDIIKNQDSMNDLSDFPGAVYAATGSLKGEILLQWDAVREARKYIIQVSKKNNSSYVWKQFDIVKDPLYCISGLKPGREYSFRVAAVYAEGLSCWSSIVTKKVK